MASEDEYQPQPVPAAPALSPSGATQTNSSKSQGAALPRQNRAEEFKLLVDNVQDYAILMLDADGRIITWNPGAERIKGYTATEILGKHFSIFYTKKDIEMGKPERVLRTAATEGRFEGKGWRVRKDGSRFWAGVVLTALRDEAGNLKGFAKITRDMTDQKQYEESLRKLTGQLLSLQDEERRRIARELHDGTAQTLSALSINLALMQMNRVVKGDPQLAKATAESEALAKQAADEVRNISHLLHPPDLDNIGLAAAIRWYTKRFAERSGISVNVNLPSNLNRIGRDLEIGLFRVIQESLANIQRHSGSKSAEVRLLQQDREVTLEVEDHGCGMPASLLGDDMEEVLQLGIGVTGMKERMRQLGGDLEFISNPGGTTVRATAPIAKFVTTSASAG